MPVDDRHTYNGPAHDSTWSQHALISSVIACHSTAECNDVETAGV